MTRYFAFTLAALLVGFSIGCGQKPGADTSVLQGATNLTGAAEVLAAIDKKDYEGALGALGKVKEALTTEEQNIQFMVLARMARDKIGESAAADPKAAEAVNALRAMTTGGR